MELVISLVTVLLSCCYSARGIYTNEQNINAGKKVKVFPITGHQGPEGEQKYSSTLSLNSPPDGGRWSRPHPN